MARKRAFHALLLNHCGHSGPQVRLMASHFQGDEVVIGYI